MKKIKLNSGYETEVDDEDYDYLSEYTWTYSKGYAKRNKNRTELRLTGRPRTVSMHRAIMKPPVGMEVDHIDGNRLNNKRNNLRVVRPFENRMNKRGKWGLLGANRNEKTCTTYMAEIVYKGKRIYLGRYKTAQEAHQAYMNKARELYGELLI